MATVRFTPNLQRHLDVPDCAVRADTVGAAMDQVFALNPRLRSYLLDDQGRVRRHVTIFIDAESIADRQHLSDPLTADAEVYVVQALSGG
ncbi:MoaD/ThiS family protein [Pseudomonas sp. GD03944]|uniref:MoaD/ThiS family protein n=1 Tax=Pseudomonas sp. GD03944 TaxID=2975409 RepID=UPI00244CDCB5|nr:MoaD/ThiS family protein [Pseudomonas sp. GD03944]MDH1265057.1 MoaD/ThiS family protein [Pseudomonas sp. GD03944]